MRVRYLVDLYKIRHDRIVLVHEVNSVLRYRWVYYSDEFVIQREIEVYTSDVFSVASTVHSSRDRAWSIDLEVAH